MNFLSLIKIAFWALFRNKLRSSLTMLGIVIGVAATVAMVSIGEGAKFSMEASISGMGTNLLFVTPGSQTASGVRTGSGSMTTLIAEDAAAIQKLCPDVQYVSAVVRGSAQVVYSNQNWYTALNGVDINFPEIRNLNIEEGNFFTEQDVRSANRVCVIGKTIVENLFENRNPIGEIIRIKKVPFKVIGTLEEKGESGNQDQDDIILMPYTTAQKKILGITRINSIFISAKAKEFIESATEQVRSLLRERHKINEKDLDDFTIRNQADLEQMANSAARIMTILLGSIASVSLVVGGIGIMNIMLVSVTERTREIGIRIAIGAYKTDILLQFIIEAIVLSVIGGVIGIIFGIGISKIISYFAEWPTVISYNSIIMSFFFAMFVGIFFGYYPARKASNLNPIDALRYE